MPSSDPETRFRSAAPVPQSPSPRKPVKPPVTPKRTSVRAAAAPSPDQVKPEPRSVARRPVLARPPSDLDRSALSTEADTTDERRFRSLAPDHEPPTKEWIRQEIKREAHTERATLSSSRPAHSNDSEGLPEEEEKPRREASEFPLFATEEEETEEEGDTNEGEPDHDGREIDYGDDPEDDAVDSDSERNELEVTSETRSDDDSSDIKPKEPLPTPGGEPDFDELEDYVEDQAPPEDWLKAPLQEFEIMVEKPKALKTKGEAILRWKEETNLLTPEARPIPGAFSWASYQRLHADLDSLNLELEPPLPPLLALPRTLDAHQEFVVLRPPRSHTSLVWSSIFDPEKPRIDSDSRQARANWQLSEFPDRDGFERLRRQAASEGISHPEFELVANEVFEFHEVAGDFALDRIVERNWLFAQRYSAQWTINRVVWQKNSRQEPRDSKRIEANQMEHRELIEKIGRVTENLRARLGDASR
ncbi:hypothetical protein JCM11491_005135 [Sporobolomyces phaffii]